MEMRTFLKSLLPRLDALGKSFSSLKSSCEQNQLSYQAMKSQFLLLKSQVEQLHNLASSSLEHHDQD